MVKQFVNKGTPAFSQGLANWKRNPNENPGVGLILLKSIMIFKQAQRSVELSDKTSSRSGSKSAVANSTVRDYLYPVNRTPIDDPISGRECASMRVDK